MLHTEDRKPEPGILQALVDRADHSGRLDFEQFTDVALYHPLHGYYRRSQQRVGRNRQSDFYTASSLGAVFAELVTASARALLPAGLEAGRTPWVEIATEPGGSPFARSDHGFGAYRPIPLGEPMRVSGQAVVFANEWLDACPFRRFVYTGGQWRECGVNLNGGWPEPCLLDAPSPHSQALLQCLESVQPGIDGYCLDLSLAAEKQLEALVSQPWRGLLLLADYGKSWEELVTACPAGTARAYYRHAATADLLARPGMQDLTCHVCWDRLAAVLHKHGFEVIEVSTQERFFMHHALQAIGRIIEDKPEAFDPRRQTLTEILHPAHMGHAFQILVARR